MTRRKKPEARCLACHMRKEFCLCGDIQSCRKFLSEQIKTSTRIEIIMHHRERHLTTNTGRLAALAIPDCRIHHRGLPYKELDCAQLLDSGRSHLLLFPGEDSIELTEESVRNLRRPVTLIVPDGSWRQAFKVAKREAAFRDVPRIVLSAGEKSRYHLRREPKESGLATFEAIARAMGLLEGPAAQKALENVFHLMVQRTLISRGFVNPETR